MLKIAQPRILLPMFSLLYIFPNDLFNGCVNLHFPFNINKDHCILSSWEQSFDRWGTGDQEEDILTTKPEPCFLESTRVLHTGLCCFALSWAAVNSVGPLCFLHCWKCHCAVLYVEEEEEVENDLLWLSWPSQVSNCRRGMELVGNSNGSSLASILPTELVYYHSLKHSYRFWE